MHEDTIKFVVWICTHLHKYVYINFSTKAKPDYLLSTNILVELLIIADIPNIIITFYL
jgi:hypothetical protein